MLKVRLDLEDFPHFLLDMLNGLGVQFWSHHCFQLNMDVTDLLHQSKLLSQITNNRKGDRDCDPMIRPATS